jgi:hypothetical protein
MNRTRGFVRIAAVAAATFGALATAAPSHAFRMIQNTATGRVTAGSLVTCNAAGGFTHWTTAATSWRLNTANQGSGKAVALQAAMAAWTNVSSANHVLTYAGTTTAGWATDGTNTLLWAAGNGCTNTNNCLALTALVLQAGQVIVESDVTFNNLVTWTTTGSQYDTQTVATHELGHALGIHHTEVTSSPQPTMTATYFGNGGRTLEADDIAALRCSQCRYPPPGAPAEPTSLTIQPEFCRGLNTLVWTASCGTVTHYELYRSPYSSFTSQTLEYSGTGTSKFVNVSGTTYFRVRACNGTSCSPYRVAPGAAQYHSGECF